MSDAADYSADKNAIGVAIHIGKLNPMGPRVADQIKKLVEDRLNEQGLPNRVFTRIIDDFKGVAAQVNVKGWLYVDPRTKRSLFGINDLANQFEYIRVMFEATPDNNRNRKVTSPVPRNK